MLLLPRSTGELTPPSLAECVELEQAAGFELGAFHRQWLIQNRAPAEVRRNLELGRRHPNLVMGRQGFGSFDSNDPASAAFGARNTSASELMMLQDVGGSVNGVSSQGVINQYCSIPANDPRVGKTYQIKLNGLYGNTATPTMTFTPRWGSNTTPATNVTLGASTAWTSITGTTGLPYLITFDFTIRTTPPGVALATGIGFGTVILGIPLTSSQLAAVLPIGGTAAAGLDTSGTGTAGLGLTMNLTWGASSASNTQTCHQCYPVRSLN